MTELMENKISHRVFIAAPPEKVYDTITSGDGWNAFFTQATEVDPKPGGKIVFRWRDYGPNFYTTDAEGEVLKTNRPNLFVFQWYPVGREHPTTIEITLTPQYSGTVISLTERGYPDTPEGRSMIIECATGWGEALTLLKFYLERGIVYILPKKDL